METLSEDCEDETGEKCLKAAGLDRVEVIPELKVTETPLPPLEAEVLYGFRMWHIMFLSAAAILGVVILLCCCFKFRIPRTKQEIEGDFIRRKILRKFRRRLKTIQNQELDEMDLKRGALLPSV